MWTWMTESASVVWVITPVTQRQHTWVVWCVTYLKPVSQRKAADSKTLPSLISQTEETKLTDWVWHVFLCSLLKRNKDDAEDEAPALWNLLSSAASLSERQRWKKTNKAKERSRKVGEWVRASLSFSDRQLRIWEQTQKWEIFIFWLWIILKSLTKKMDEAFTSDSVSNLTRF